LDFQLFARSLSRDYNQRLKVRQRTPDSELSRRNNRPTTTLDEAINQIASDNSSGAAEILRRAGAVFTLLNRRSAEEAPADLANAQRLVTDICVALTLAQPDMSPLLRLASAALSAARIPTIASHALQAAQDSALNFIENAERAARDAALHAAALIGDGATVLTHSRSSTVLAALLEAKRLGRAFSVVATESRPMLEGRTLAEAIAREDISVALIADAAASLAMERVDLVRVGADKMTPVNLVNKIGTRMIALAAEERGLPAYAICDTSKFIGDDCFSRPIRESGTASEVWPDAPKGVAVVNRYFEPTPLALFTAVVTEDGALPVEEATRRAAQASPDQTLVEAIAAFRDEIK